jgi:hypothetical protein
MGILSLVNLHKQHYTRKNSIFNVKVEEKRYHTFKGVRYSLGVSTLSSLSRVFFILSFKTFQGSVNSFARSIKDSSQKGMIPIIAPKNPLNTPYHPIRPYPTTALHSKPSQTENRPQHNLQNPSEPFKDGGVQTGRWGCCDGFGVFTKCREYCSVWNGW